MSVGVAVLVFLVALRMATRLTELDIGVSMSTAKALGFVGIAALRPAIPRGALPAWRLWLVGGALNLLAIGLGGGRMPVAESALMAADLPPPAPGYVIATTRLQVLLGDSIPVRWPVGTAVSIGDIVLLAGLVAFAFFLWRSPAIARPRPRDDVSNAAL